jgi:hypothetical protein
MRRLAAGQSAGQPGPATPATPDAGQHGHPGSRPAVWLLVRTTRPGRAAWSPARVGWPGHTMGPADRTMVQLGLAAAQRELGGVAGDEISRPINRAWRRETEPMKYLSVLTPPLLVCAVFLIAVIAFLRHEMGSRRSRAGDRSGDNSADPIQSHDEPASSQHRGTSDLSDDD